MFRILAFLLLITFTLSVSSQSKNSSHKKSGRGTKSSTKKTSSKTNSYRFTTEDIREINKSWVQDELNFEETQNLVSTNPANPTIPKVEEKKSEEVKAIPLSDKKFPNANEKTVFWETIISFLMANKSKFGIGALVIFFAIYRLRNAGRSNYPESGRIFSKFRNK
jgi:hypothetical protein